MTSTSRGRSSVRWAIAVVLLALVAWRGLFVDRDQSTGGGAGEPVAGLPLPSQPANPTAPTTPPSLATAPRPPAAPPSPATSGFAAGATPANPVAPAAEAGRPAPQGSRVRGVVLRPDGSPFGGVTVFAESADAARHSSVYADTEADGSYVLLGLRAGRWRVRVSRADRLVEIAAVDVSGAQDAELRVANAELPPPSPAWVAASVRIVGPEGKPIPWALMAVWIPSPTGDARTGGMRFGGFADYQDGMFHRLDPEPPGTKYLVFAAAGSRSGPNLGYAPVKLVADSASPIPGEVRLQAGQTVEGRVEAEDGTGLPGILVSAYASEAGAAGWDPGQRLPLVFDDVRSDATGAFVLHGVGTEPVFVAALGEAPYVAAGASTTVPGGARAIRLVLRKGREARVTVLDPAGRPVAQANVDAGIPLLSTNAEGVLVLTGLDPAAEIALRVSPPLARADLRGTTLPHWRAADVTVRLERGYHVRGRVVAPDGERGVSGVVQHLVGTEWKTVAGMQPDGTFEVRGLAEGPWTFRASGFMADSPKGPPVEVADESTDIRLVLPEAPSPPVRK